MIQALALLCLIGSVQSQSVSWCGAADDHLSNVKISLSPDPVKVGSNFTLDVSGDLNEELSAFTMDYDLDISVMANKKNLKMSVPFTYSPGFAIGPTKITVGPAPFYFVKLPLGAYLKVTGTIKLTNAKQEQVTCVKLNMKVGVDEEVAGPALASSFNRAGPGRVCSGPSAHLKNIAFSADPSGVNTITGTLDEDIDKLTVVAGVHVTPTVIPDVALNLPISISPGLKKGDLKITAGPTKLNGLDLSSGLSDDPVTVAATLKAMDGQGEEIFCLGINASSDAYTCSAGSCVADPSGVPLKTCQSVCKQPSAYVCTSGKCVPGSGGLPLKTCQAACGGFDSLVV